MCAVSVEEALGALSHGFFCGLSLFLRAEMDEHEIKVEKAHKEKQDD